MKKQANAPLFVGRKSPLVLAAALFMVISAIIRLWYYSAAWPTGFTLYLHVALPVACALLYALFLFLWGHKTLVPTILPVGLGCVFFLLKALAFTWWHGALCALLYLLVFLLYYNTVRGRFLTTKPLSLVFLLPLLYHVFVEDPLLVKNARPFDWLPEVSVLLIMAGLLLATLGMLRLTPAGVRRYSDRSDGRRLRSLSPIFQVSPYIMKTRAGSQNYIMDRFEFSAVEEYIREKRWAGMPNFGVMHLITAAYVRAVSQMPGINRFISGQKIYAREDIEVVMTIKKVMSADSPDTVLKLYFKPTDTTKEVYEIFNAEIERNKGGDKANGFDSTAKILNYIPGLVMKFVVWLLGILDYFGLLPRFLTKVSPFHGSMYITSMGSLGIPPIFHHLYDFGNVPVFCAFGPKRKEREAAAAGGAVTKRYVDYTFVTDERICDGFYFAAALKLIRGYLRNPSVLDMSPAKVTRDVD